MNSGFAQLYVFGAAAAWQMHAVELAREWVAKLSEHPAFNSLQAVRVALMSSYDPVAIGQFEHIMKLLREAGLPAQQGVQPAAA